MPRFLSALLLISFLAAPLAAHATDAPAKVSPAKAAIDTDGDGFVSKAEFMTAQEKRFVETDANKDGKISDDEHRASYQKWREKRAQLRDKADGQQPE